MDKRQQKQPDTFGSGRSWPELYPGEDDGIRPSIRRRHLTYTTPYQNHYQVTADFGSFTKQYFVNEGKPRAGVVVDRRGEILLVRQYRLLIDRVSFEVPGGAVDKGETPKQAAIRECFEETGVRCASVQPLLSFHLGLDSLYSPTYLFYSTDVAVEEDLSGMHRNEVVGWEWVPLEQCIEMIFARKIVDSFSIAALLSYRIITPRIDSGGGEH